MIGQSSPSAIFVLYWVILMQSAASRAAARRSNNPLIASSIRSIRCLSVPRLLTAATQFGAFSSTCAIDLAFKSNNANSAIIGECVNSIAIEMHAMPTDLPEPIWPTMMPLRFHPYCEDSFKSISSTLPSSSMPIGKRQNFGPGFQRSAHNCSVSSTRASRMPNVSSNVLPGARPS